MHAKTLRLDECHEPNEGENHEAEVWKKKYADLAARLAKLENAHPLPERMPATPKELFPVTSPSTSVKSASATPSPAVPPKAGLIPPAKSPATVPVPKRSEPPPKAVPPGEPSSSASGECGSFKAGEEEMAEQLDLSHEDRAGNMLTIIVFVLLNKKTQVLLRNFEPCQELTTHALYMRLKRLCQKTPAGKLNVDQTIHEQWTSGNRDELLLALVRSMKACGFDSSHRTRMNVRARCYKRYNFTC